MKAQLHMKLDQFDLAQLVRLSDASFIVCTNQQPFYNPLIQDNAGEQFSHNRDFLEPPLDSYEPDVFPLLRLSL